MKYFFFKIKYFVIGICLARLRKSKSILLKIINKNTNFTRLPNWLHEVTRSHPYIMKNVTCCKNLF